MKTQVWRWLSHVELLTQMTLLALHLAAVIERVHGATSNQLPLSGTLDYDSSLVSSNGAFELGFFSGSGGFVFGIRYAQLPAASQTVVWMPQRDVQLSSSAYLQLSQSGVLQLFDTVTSTPQQLWNSGNQLVLQLGDDGNLVLLNATLGVVWQSFDTPTDTLLPGQVLRSTSNRSLTAWRGLDDWAVGYYFCGWLPFNGSVFLTLYWNGQSIPNWNTSSWSSNNVTLGNGTVVYPYQIDFQLSNYMSLSTNGSFFVGNASYPNLVMSSASNAIGPLRRVTLDYDGNLKLYSWMFPTSQVWTLESSWTPPLGPCAVFAECGPYGVCEPDPQSAAYLGSCWCPEGFLPIDPNDMFKGCERQYEIPPGVCALNTTKLEMVEVGYMDFPYADRLYPYVITNETACTQLCLDDCRCNGAVFWRYDGRCYVKSDPLFNGGFPQDEGNHTAYLKILSGPLNPPSDRVPVDLIVGSVAAGVILVCLGMALVMWRCWKRRGSMVLNHPMFADQIACPRKFTLRELSAATKNFSSSELIGAGGMGSVYKGELKPKGIVVAVKQIRQESRGSEQGFLAEASSISQIRHRNLVQLKGWCMEEGRLLLVYDFMPNGSLDQWLYDRRRERTGKELSWNLRYSILTGIAAALTYLHEDWQQCVLHRDVKSSNVLLDAEFNAHLGDFGLARLIDHQKMEKTTLMAGTLGYMAPEMPYTGKATKETDVYSFGVLMLEVVCGRKPVDSSGDVDPEDVILLHRVWRAYENGRLLSTVDPRLCVTPHERSNYGSLNGSLNGSAKRKPQPDDHALDVAEADFAGALTRRIEEEKARENDQKRLSLKLGLLCCLPTPGARPSMRLVHQILSSGDATALPPLPDTNLWATHLDFFKSSRPDSLSQPELDFDSLSSSLLSPGIRIPLDDAAD